MNSLSSTVRQALATQLHCLHSAIHPSHRLEGDLNLSPLEVVLVALAVKDQEGVEIAPEALANVETVEELCALFQPTKH